MNEILSKVLRIFFILSIFSFNLDSGELTCWRCDPCPDPHSDASPLVSAVTCTSSETVCVKNTLRVLNQPEQISKGCVQTCTPSSSTFFGQGDSVDCCNSNNCNLSIRNQLSTSIYLLVIIVVFLN